MNNQKIKVLVITYYPWREDNNVGNSYSNLFAGMNDKIEFSQIYMRNDMPQNKLVHNYFQISEISLLKNLFTNRKVGKHFVLNNPYNTSKGTFSKAFNIARVLRWDIFLLIRELAGISSNWKSKELKEFLKETNPDIIFGTLPSSTLTSRVMLYAKSHSNAKLITYSWDDYYSLQHRSISPFFWILKFISRYNLKRTAKESEFLYVISDILKEEYTQIFNKECKLLYKGHRFNIQPQYKTTTKPIKMIYMGNIGGGRWKTLASLAASISEINKNYKKQMIFLEIYTLSAKSKKITESLNIINSSQIMPPVPNEEVQNTMNSADILLHAEPWKGKECSFYRASFSTKIVDYFYAAKCILAIGGFTASTKYLEQNDAAIIIKEKKYIKSTLYNIIENTNLIETYAQKSWECGYKNHQIGPIQEMLYNDFKNTIK